MNRAPCRAFTLTEAAIVLLIVGLITGALWAAGSAIQKSAQVNTASDQIYEIAANMRALYASRQTITGADNAFNITMDQSRVFPIDMRRNRAVEGGPVDHVWNKGITGGSVQVAGYDLAAGTTSPSAPPARSFRVQFLSLPSDICTKLVLHEFVADQNTRLEAIVVRGGAATSFLASAGALPPSLVAASAACNSSTSPSVDWVFSLH